MHLTDKAEEILETLWIEAVERDNPPDIRMFKDNDNFKELLDGGYTSLKNNDLLTEKGRKEGRLCVRRHRLAERLLRDVLNVGESLVHEVGCKFEHALHKGVEDNICILLGHPRKCPHGRTIPEGDCCRKGIKTPDSLVKPLSYLKKAEKGKIAYIHTDDPEILRKIMAMGALPGASITLLQRFPSFVFQVGNSQFAVDKTLAGKIQVWLSR